MRLLVCIKQVLESETAVFLDQAKTWIETEAQARYGMNDADQFALEEALMIKEARADTKVDVLTVGPGRAGQVLERALGMGADRAVHVLAEAEGYLAPLIIASWIAHYIRERDYGLILTGIMAQDDMQGQVGPMVAELLGVPCATSVIFEEVDSEKKSVYVEREIEGGLREMFVLDLPAVMTIQTGINRPRYPSLSNLLRAKRQKALVIDAETLPPVEGREKVVGIDYPRKSGTGDVLHGTPQEKALRLIEILKDKAFL